MHPATLTLAALLLLPLYGILVVVGAISERKLLWAQLPYVLGVSLLFVFIEHENLWRFGAATVAYCAVTWTLIFGLRRLEK